MKKVLLGLGCILCFAGLASAQEGAKKASRATQIKKAKISAKATPAETVAPVKKEGTANMRLRESTPAQKRLETLKKDKSLDKRVSNKNKMKKG